MILDWFEVITSKMSMRLGEITDSIARKMRFYRQGHSIVAYIMAWLMSSSERDIEKIVEVNRRAAKLYRFWLIKAVICGAFIRRVVIYDKKMNGRKMSVIFFRTKCRNRKGKIEVIVERIDDNELLEELALPIATLLDFKLEIVKDMKYIDREDPNFRMKIKNGVIYVRKKG